MSTQGLTHLPARDPGSGLVHVVVDTPRGSRNKFKYDEKLGLFRLSKVLPLGACFPYDFGFIPSTRAGDGDPVDVLVLADEPAFPGCLLPVRLLGVIRAEQTEKGKTVQNDRLLGVVETPYNPPMARSLDELPASRLDEIEHFFVSYNRAEGREFRPTGREGPEVAEELVEAGMRSFRKSRGDKGR
jgi:inorganic pyrophosphatase